MSEGSGKTGVSHREARRPTPAMGNVRLAETDDAAVILDLCTDAMKTTFRIKDKHDIKYLIENAVLSICPLDVNKGVIGFLSVREYPLIPSLHPTAWEEYIWTKYKAIELNGRNTLFIHMLCWKIHYSREVVDFMLKTIFMHDPYVHYIAMVKTVVSCPQLIAGSSRAEALFRRVQAMERGLPGDKLPALLIAERKEICPRLRVRRAVEEDNDDIVPIIERHSDRLRELYGDYYISELISRHPESERVLLVCEHKEVAVGVMCLNTQINFESLEDCFELSPFAGLRHLDESPVMKTDKEIESTSFIYDPMISTQDSANVLDTMANTAGFSKSRFAAETTEEQEIMLADGADVDESSMFNYIDLFNDEDEEEVEFDIINIDPDLLKLPDFFSLDEELNKNILDGVHLESKEDQLYSRKKKSMALPSGTLLKTDNTIRYTGSSNAFLLELFAMHPDYDERYGFDMLEATYELFPNRDYCIVCLPSHHTSFPLLEHFTLVTVLHSRMRFINESLYVAHINSVRGDIRVRPAEFYDIDGLVDILEHTPRRDALMDLFETSLLSRSINGFMLLAQNQPIGVVITGPLEEGVSIRARYALEPEPRPMGSDGAILCGVMSPVMEPHSRWYLRDILRRSKYTSLFWICQPFTKGEQSAQRNMMSFAERMIPVRPRSFLPNITGDKDLDRIFRETSTPFALWLIERPLSSIPKVYANNGILVVGASRTGLAFIEALIMGRTAKYLTFTNITLVSEHGLPTVSDCLKAADTCIPREGRYTNHYLKSVPFCYYIDVIPAVMVHIDRKKKCIHLKGGGVKYYDELVLACGQQFQHPEYLKESLERAKEVRKNRPCERMLMDNPKYQSDKLPPPPDLPANVFLINSVIHANIAMKRLLRMMADSGKDTYLSDENPIVIYGDCLEAYSCMAALIDLGIAGYEIAFVENFPPEDHTAVRVNCFNDDTVDERVQQSLDFLGVKLLRQCRLISWKLKDKMVTHINLMSPLHYINLKCFALFYYGLKSTDIHAFKAINECGLVYDGGLVVSPMFETNDPHIYGAGTITTYSRRLYATSFFHRYYNSEDVGEALAELFLCKMDPFVACHPEYSVGDIMPRYSDSVYGCKHPSIPECTRSRLSLIQPLARRWQPVMKFQSPLVKYAILPGSLYYLKIRKPGLELPMEVQRSLPHQGHVLKTDKNNDYFCVQLNVLHCIEFVTCLSKNPFPHEIFSQLYGKHEALFNKLLLRYQMEQIQDFFSFFVQPWIASIYQENFQDLVYNINHQDVSKVYEGLKQKYALFQEEEKQEKEPPPITPSRLSSIQTPIELEPPKKVWTLRAVLDKYVTSLSAQMERIHPHADIPSECGQSATMRDEVTGFWEAIGGERFVFGQIASHVARNSVTNPHIAPPKPEYFE